MYQNIGNVACISGQNGHYSDKSLNPSVAWAKNACHNYMSYIDGFKINPVEMPDLSNISTLSEDKFEAKMQELDNAISKLQEQTPPLNFSCTYTPSGIIDRNAVLAFAYEELGKKIAIQTQELTKSLQQVANDCYEENKVQMSAQALDINNDGLVDVGEYASSILVADALSADRNILNSRNINGVFNAQGKNALLSYAKVSNYQIASATFRGIYEAYGLDRAKNEFLLNQNNLI